MIIAVLSTLSRGFAFVRAVLADTQALRAAHHRLHPGLSASE